LENEYQNNQKWQKTSTGKLKKLTPKLTFEIVQNAAHYVGMYQANIIVDRLKNLINDIGKDED